MPKTKTIRFDISEHIRTPEEMTTVASNNEYSVRWTEAFGKPMKTLLYFVIPLLAFCGCQLTGSRQAGNAEKTAADIRFALANYIFKNNASGGQQSVDFYFLEIAGKDPGEEFLERFAGHNPVVLPASLANASNVKGVSHKEKNGVGLIFTIGTFEWVTDSEVNVTWGYYEDGLSASGNTATLKFKKNRWVVTNDEMHWIAQWEAKPFGADNDTPLGV